MPAEKLFENKIKKYLKERGHWYVKYWAGSQYTSAGIPDLLCCINGLFVGIELKAPTGKPSELQLHNIELIKKSNGLAFVLYPKDFEKFKKIVEFLETHQSNDFSSLWELGVI